MQADRHQHAADTDRGRGLPRPVVRSPETAGPQQAAPRLADGLSPAAALSLQRAIGNAAVARLVEQERHQHGADCGHGATVQRSTGDQAVQRDALDRVDAVTRTSGSPLRTDVRHRMESDYGGEDFSDVRVHVDRDSAEAVGAKAYTTKTHHIVFRSTADMDDHTMRHELQHVRQQRAGGVPSGISAPTDAWERDAESTAAELGRRPADVQRSPAREHNRTSAPGVAVQRMPSSPSRKERGRSRSGSDCRIEARGSGSRVRVSRSSGPARSPRDETGPTVHTYRNDDSVVRNQASVIGYRGTFTRNLGPGIRHQGPVIPDESGPTVHHYWNRRSLILDQAPVIWKQGTITHNLGPDIPSRATVTRDGTGPTTYSYENEDEVIRAQGAVENRGGLYTRNVPGSAAHAEEGDVNAANVFNLFGRRSADDPGWAQETNWEFNAPTPDSRGRRLVHGNHFDTGGRDIRHGAGGTVYHGNVFNAPGGHITGRNFHLSSGIEEPLRGGAVPPPISPEQFRAQWPTVLNFDGEFTVEGNASLFIGNLFDAGEFSAWSPQQGGRSGEQTADHGDGDTFPDYAQEDLYVGNTFSIRGGTITLSGGIYFRNSFSATKIIIRGNAVFVGGNSFHGEVEVDNPDLLAQELYLGEITGPHADRVTPL